MSARGLTLVGLSGGVDSSVAALLLKRDTKRDLAGLFMQNWDEEGDGGCRADEDRRDALAVAARLGIPFHTANFASDYWHDVFEHFLAEYRVGRTPNPDVLCNREIKFKRFLDHARQLGADRIATGQYARVGRGEAGFQLLRGVDTGKDQSYFLHQLGQSQLSVTDFPVGHLPKSEVRRLATEAGLPTSRKKDSTGICFIGERDFRDFLSTYLPAQPGELRTVEGNLVGEHPGAFFFTLGQREGLAIGGVRGRAAAPWYVVGKDIARNTVYVDQGHDSPWLMSDELDTETMHWVAGSAPSSQFRCTAKTRYRQADEACEVECLPDRRLHVRFNRPQRAVTPGQSVVLYQDDVCLGGAVIATTNAALERQLKQDAA